jgi:hypothetical protein
MLRHNIILFLVISFTFCSAQTGTKLKAVWTEIDTLNIARYAHASIVLPNGNILVSGGIGNGTAKSCEIYDLQTKKWRSTASMNNGREYHKMFLLGNGRVIAIGGSNNRSCEIFDLETETWTDTDSLLTNRFLWESTLQLRDGSILVSGGYRFQNNAPFHIELNECELYNPETRRWKTITPLNEARYSHSSIELSNGKILITGGVGNGGNQLKSCEIYDLVQNNWILADSLNIQRDSHASFLLPNGNVFIAGGNCETVFTYFPQNSCEVYYSEINSWVVTDTLFYARTNHDIYKINNIGKLILLSNTEFGITWEAYDPENLRAICKGEGPNYKIYDHNSIQMKDEKIMLIGGEDVFNIDTLPWLVPSNKCYILSVEIGMAVERTGELPKDFCMYQNYPNPFNPTTKIKFSITKTSRVSLTVYDMLGRIVTKLIDNEEKSAGVYVADFNARGLASGVYFYQLSAGNKVYTNKMLFTK